MILIDALYINEGGGNILLNYFVEEVVKYSNNVYFLFDKRVEDRYKDFPIKNKVFINSTLINRLKFYIKHQNKFSKVLTFANLPPPIKLKCEVTTFFQNVLFLNNHNNSIKFLIKKIYFKFLIKNTDFWVVQTNNVKNILLKNKIYENNILVLPFFKEKKIGKKIKTTKELCYLYVSNGESYKNHENLFKAFSIFNKDQPNSKLLVTIAEKYKHLHKIINEYRVNGINIINVYSNSHEEIMEQYQNADFAIYPSLFESFGLGLIEASQSCLPIIASNLPYVHEVVIPVEVFDPYDYKSILSSFSKSLNLINHHSTLVVENKCEQLIKKIINI